MKKLLVLSSVCVVVLCVSRFTSAQVGNPEFRELKLITQLPKEVPPRINSLAYDGESLWASLYQTVGIYAKLDPSTLTWTIDDKMERRRAIVAVTPKFLSPGGFCFVKTKLWVAGSYGESFGSIDTATWKVEKSYARKQQQDIAGQSYSSLACDGNHIWMAWHWFKYDRPISETQLLLKIDPESGNVIAQFPAPGGKPSDGAAGLTWDGSRLWYMKDSKLSAIDPVTGTVAAQYVLDSIKRPSGLAWVNQSLWISEFDGKIWRLSFKS